MTCKNKNLIFIIGSGRSGTHFLAETIAKNEKVEAFIEDERYFMSISNLAAGIGNPKRFHLHLSQFEGYFTKSLKQYILDKTHPNIWFVEEIIQKFPEAKFIGLSRDVYSTVSSMLQHPGVLNWYKILPLNKENPFLGITKKNKKRFENFPIESKCAIRCLSHNSRLSYLRTTFPENVLNIEYDNLYANCTEVREKLESFLGIGIDLAESSLLPKANQKWKNNLTEMEINNIKKSIKHWENS